jgi:hypothetical protein
VEQSLGAEALASWQPVRPVSERAQNGKGAALPDEGRKAARGEKPLNERTLHVAAGWNKPASRTAEKTVEGLRKSEGGT